MRKHLARRGSEDKVDMYLERLQAWNAMKGQYDIVTKKKCWCAEEWVKEFIFNDELTAFLG